MPSSSGTDDNWEDFLEFYREQFRWYDSKAVRNKRLYYLVRGIVISIAATLPVAVTVDILTGSAPVRYGLLVATVILLLAESILSLTNCETDWHTYRTTAEALRKEREALRMEIGPYHDADDPRKEFARRVLELASEEHRVWRLLTDDDTPKLSG